MRTLRLRVVRDSPRRVTRFLPAIISGVLIALSSAPWDQWYLAYVGFIPLFLHTRRASPVACGKAYALCCSVIAVNWWHSAILFSALYFVLIVVILCGTFFLWGFLTAAYRSAATHPVIALYAPCAIWIGMERLLTSNWVGIPCNFGITQSGQPLLIQSASLFGIYASSFLIMLSNIALAQLIGAWRDRRPIQPMQAMAIGTAVLLMGLNVWFGYSRTSEPLALKKPVKVAVVQPMISRELYLNGWRNPEDREFVRSTLDQLTREALGAKPDILVWPEGGNGFPNMRIAGLRDNLYRMAARHRTDLLISSLDVDEDGRQYNSVFSISKHGRLLGRYDKVYLVPVAEDEFSAGNGFQAIATSYGKVGPVICYESNFPAPLRKATAAGAELLFVSTSDAAFRKTSLTVNHTRTAVFRAIENNRWVIHASNTGPSVIVSPWGHITASAPMYRRAYLAGDVGFVQEMSFFTRVGHLVPSLLSILTVTLLVIRLYRGIQRMRDPVARPRVTKSPPKMTTASARAGGTEHRLKAWLGAASTVLPAASLHGALLGAVVAGSILLVNRQTTPDHPVFAALRDFAAPANTQKPETVTAAFLQATKNSCGPAVLAYVFSFLGKEAREDDLLRQMTLTDQGVNMLEMKNVAIRNGFQAVGVRENYQALLEEPLPVIAYINNSHYVVVLEIGRHDVYVFDPAIGHVTVPRRVFEQVWNGYLLLIRMPRIEPEITPSEKRVLPVRAPIPAYANTHSDPASRSGNPRM